MIIYIKGLIIFKNFIFIVVEVGGVGYYINISLYIYVQIEKVDQVCILMYQYIKEDVYIFYGFVEDLECNFFCLFILVSGVGLVIVQIVFLSLIFDELCSVIIGEDVSIFKWVKGIGLKMVKCIILDLKDKVLKDSGEILIFSIFKDNMLCEEVLFVLLVLGFFRFQVQCSFNCIV